MTETELSPPRGFVCDNCGEVVLITTQTEQTVAALRRDHEKECLA